MAGFCFSAWLAIGIAATAWAADTCDKDTGGTCNVMACYNWRGPTNCVRIGMKYTCLCQDGYCASKGRCVAAPTPEQAPAPAPTPVPAADAAPELKDKAVVIVVDPSWDDVGSYYVNVPLLRQFRIVKVSTHTGKHRKFAPGHAPIYKEFVYSSESPDPVAANKELCPVLKELDVPIEAVMPTSDPTVHFTDLLADCLGLRGNPAHGPLADARRNKWVMGEAVRKAGLRTIHQAIVSSWEEIEAYVSKMDPPLSHTHPVVFKILQGSGGEGTSRINNVAEAKKFWDVEHGSVSKAKEVNTRLLIQEYLFGTEYAIDSVTRNGVHKVVDVWIEDFRPANGIFDQYFGFKLQDTADPKIARIIEYAHKVLTALGVENGATNTEVKWLDSEGQPCLVEVNARWAGMNWHDGLAVENACMGNNQITATFTSYLDEEGFNAMPVVPPMKLYGASIASINYKPGIVKAVPGLEAAKGYSSYHDSDVDCPASYPESSLIGKFLDKTIPDCIPVRIAFVSKDKSAVEADYNRAISLVYKQQFFDTEPQVSSQSLDTAGHHPVDYTIMAAFGFCSLVFVAVYRFRHQTDTDSDYYIAVE
jgi:hypothetical protein